MAAPAGNRFWELRSSHGRAPIFKTADDMWSAACEYFEWVEENPLLETKGFAFQGVVTKETFPKMRAMTVDGLCLFLDISKQAWSEYKQRDGFGDVLTSRSEGTVNENNQRNSKWLAAGSVKALAGLLVRSRKRHVRWRRERQLKE